MRDIVDNLILLSFIASAALTVFTFMQERKKTTTLNELKANNNFQEYKYANTYFVLLGILAILSLVMIYFSISSGEETSIALSIILITVVIVEPLIIYRNLKFFYNDTSCIIEDKLVRYKSIKEFRPALSLPLFKKLELVTLNNEKFKVDKKIADLIETKMKEQQEAKTSNEKKNKKKKSS